MSVLELMWGHGMSRGIEIREVNVNGHRISWDDAARWETCTYREPYRAPARREVAADRVCESVCVPCCVRLQYGCREPQSDARATDVLYALEMLHDLKAQFV